MNVDARRRISVSRLKNWESRVSRLEDSQNQKLDDAAHLPIFVPAWVTTAKGGEHKGKRRALIFSERPVVRF